MLKKIATARYLKPIVTALEFIMQIRDGSSETKNNFDEVRILVVIIYLHNFIHKIPMHADLILRGKVGKTRQLYYLCFEILVTG
jgi:hypothetical protein